jgi:hypothetical protein
VRANIAELTTRLADQRKQLAPLQAIVVDASSSVERRAEYGRVFYDAQNRIIRVEGEMDRLQAQLNEERMKETQILAETPTATAHPRQDFYEWIGSLFGIKPETVELVSALFPSIFIDLIASIGLAVALFLTTERRRE